LLKIAFVVALLTTVALLDRAQSSEPPQVQVFAICRPRRRRVRCGGFRPRVGAVGRWWPVRLCRELQRMMLVGGASLVAGSGLWPVAAVGSLLLFRQLVLALAVGLASDRLLGWVRVLERIARTGASLSLFVFLVAALEHVHQGADFSCAAALVAAPSSQIGSRQAGVSVRVRDGQARIEICGPAVLELPVDTDKDERLAIVLCRLVLRPSDNRPLLSHQRIADAFGKNNRQNCQNHMQKLARAGGSLVRMIERARDGHNPPTIHPVVQQRIARHWQRDPLASAEQTAAWLASRTVIDGVSLPTVEQVRKMKHLAGDLVATRRAIRRQLDGDLCGVKLPMQHRRLVEVVDAQDQRLRQHGIEPPPLPGSVETTLDASDQAAPSLSRTARALLSALRGLVTAPRPEQDQQLAESVGSQLLSPLHFGLLYCLLRLSISQVATLVGRSKSVVYRGLVRFARCLEHLDLWPSARGFSGVLAIDEKWVRISKSFSTDERHKGKRWRYVHFAVDALTGDLLHADVFESSDAESVRAFLVAVRAKGIRPRVVVTDMLAAYGSAIRDTYGPGVVHHFCLFHHLQAIRHRLRDKCGKDWKKQPLLRQLVEQTDNIYKCRDRRTAKRRLAKVLALRDKLERDHPEAVTVLDTLQQRFPLVANAIGRNQVPTTNNVVERTIKAFNRHYKLMAGFESLDTARIQVTLFAFFYRLTPMREPAQKEDRGVCPLQKAGWSLHGVPVADYVRRFVHAWDEDGPDLFAVAPQPPTEARTPAHQDDQALAAAA
jgi:transposase-like protein